MKKTYDVGKFKAIVLENGDVKIIPCLLPIDAKRPETYAKWFTTGEILKVTKDPDDAVKMTLEYPDKLFMRDAHQIDAEKRRNMVSRTITSSIINCIYWNGENAVKQLIIMPNKMTVKEASKIENVLKVFGIEYTSTLYAMPDDEFFAKSLARGLEEFKTEKDS